MASKVPGKKQQLLSMRYNQRSQMQFQFTELGSCGRRGKLWESLPKLERATIKQNNPDWVLEDPDGEHHLYWKEPPTIILVIKKFKDVGVTKKFKTLTRWLVEEKHLTVTVEPSIFVEKEIKEDVTFANVSDSFMTWDDHIKGNKEKLLHEVDLIICVGGDGTLLYTSSMFQDKFPPIMSFHMGSLGFLTPFQFGSSPEDQISEGESEKSYQKHIEKVLKGGVSLTLRLRLECKIRTVDTVSTVENSDTCPLSPNEKPLQFASHFGLTNKVPWKREDEIQKEMLVMNDLVVDRGPNPYLTNLLIKCNGRPMTTVQGDGIIIATPTGSTAYSLAAGASMVHPSVPCIIITPICPHSLSFRSIVVPSGVELEIMLNASSRNSAWVSFDGRNRQEIAKGDSVVINTCKWPIPSINNTGHVTDWFDSLAECLNWNVRKEQKKFDSA